MRAPNQQLFHDVRVLGLDWLIKSFDFFEMFISFKVYSLCECISRWNRRSFNSLPTCALWSMDAFSKLMNISWFSIQCSLRVLRQNLFDMFGFPRNQTITWSILDVLHKIRVQIEDASAYFISPWGGSEFEAYPLPSSRLGSSSLCASFSSAI